MAGTRTPPALQATLATATTDLATFTTKAQVASAAPAAVVAKVLAIAVGVAATVLGNDSVI